MGKKGALFVVHCVGQLFIYILLFLLILQKFNEFNKKVLRKKLQRSLRI